MLIAAARGERPPRKTDSTARLHRIAASRNLDHRLGINQFFTDLAAYERTHPNARLHHWWPDSRMETFVPPGTMTIGSPQADGLGVWTEDEQTVVFYLEHDTGYEALTVLCDKVHRYAQFHRRGAPAWPVVFWLHSAVREAHFHRRLAEPPHPRVPMATAARDRVGDLNPAEQVWNLFGAALPLLQLAELPMPDPVDITAFDEASRG